jgi:hypothetical protein
MSCFSCHIGLFHISSFCIRISDKQVDVSEHIQITFVESVSQKMAQSRAGEREGVKHDEVENEFNSGQENGFLLCQLLAGWP